MWLQAVIGSLLFACSLAQNDTTTEETIFSEPFNFSSAPSILNNTYSIKFVSDSANPQRAEYTLPNTSSVTFYDLTACWWMRPTKNLITIFSFKTDENETNYLSLTLNLESQRGYFHYASAPVVLNLPVIPLNVWTHFCITTTTEDAAGNDICTLFYVYVNNTYLGETKFEGSPNDQILGTFTLGQKTMEEDPTQWDIEAGMEGEILNFVMWNENQDDALGDVDDNLKYGSYPCFDKNGTFINWRYTEWTYVGATRQNMSLECSTDRPTLTASKKAVTTTPATTTTAGLVGGVVGGVGNTVGSILDGLIGLVFG